jgi:hypothetical protein
LPVLFLIFNSIYKCFSPQFNNLSNSTNRLKAQGSRLEVCSSELRVRPFRRPRSSEKSTRTLLRVPFEYINIFNKDLKSRILWGCLVTLIVSILVPCAAVAETATVTLAWDPPSSGAVAGYKVHYGETSQNYQYHVDVKNNTSCSISGLEEGKTYYFAATAYDSNNLESALSEELAHTVAYQSPPPPVDTDGDGILDEDEINIYGTDPDQSDTDNDGMHDGEEAQYWGNRWNLDIDGDGAINLLDADSDGDGYSDGIEVTNGNDPASPPDVTHAGARTTQGLQVLYNFDEGSGTTVYDTSGSGEPLDLTVDSGTVNWVSGGLAITSAALIKSAGPATKIIEACQVTNEISIEAWVKPANTTQRGPARIITLSENPSVRNFTLGQDGDTFNQRLRTTATSANGIPSLATPQGYLNTELTHVLYTFDSAGVARIYVNGAEASSQTIGGDFSNWNGNYHFGLANEMTKDRPWLGELYLVAVYDRALDPQEINQNFQAGINPDETNKEPDVPPTNNDPVNNPAIDPADLKLWFEAEKGRLIYPFESTGDGSASSEAFIWVPSGIGNSYDPGEESGYAEYSLQVPVSGEYFIWGRVKAASSGDNSFFVSVDGVNYALWDTAVSQTWLWDQVSDRGGDDPVTFYLEAGEHSLIIKQREDGTKIDKILITNEPAYVPETLGENPGNNQSPVANCTVDPNSGVAPLELNFDASNSTDPDGMIVLYEWDFDGDGIFDWSSPDTGDTTYTYTSSGSHNATLRVTDDEGATDTATVTIDVNEPGTEISVEEVRVGASADDAEEKASGAMYLNSSDLELVHIGSGDQTIGVRFVGVDIPQGAAIVNAYVQFKVDETGSQETFLTIEAQDTDDAQPFTSSKRNISNRTPTAAAVAWDPAAWTKVGQTGAAQRTPDISSIIQEVVDRSGWSSGNSLVLIITGSGERVAESYNGDRNGAPLLHVEYSSSP